MQLLTYTVDAYSRIVIVITLCVMARAPFHQREEDLKYDIE